VQRNSHGKLNSSAHLQNTSRGSMLLFLMVAAMFCTLGLAMSQLVLSELSAAGSQVRLQQLSNLSHQALKYYLSHEEQMVQGGAPLPELTLYPGNAPATVEVTVKNYPEGFMRLVCATASSESETGREAQLRLSPTQAMREAAEAAVIHAGGTITISDAKNKETNTSSVSEPDDSAGDSSNNDSRLSQLIVNKKSCGDFLKFSVKEMKDYAYYNNFTNISALITLAKSEGMNGLFWMSDSGSLAEFKNGEVRGDGILAFWGNVKMGPDFSVPGRIIIFCERHLTLLAGTKLPNALIFCRGTLTVNENCELGGTAFVAGNVIIAEDAKLTLNPKSTEPYESPFYRPN